MHLAECGFCEHGEQEELIAAGDTEIGWHAFRSTPTAAASPTASRSARPVCDRCTRSSPSCAARPVIVRYPAPRASASPTSTARPASAPARCCRYDRRCRASPGPRGSSPPTRRAWLQSVAAPRTDGPVGQWLRLGAVFENWTAERGASPDRPRSEPTSSAKFDAGWGALTWPVPSTAAAISRRSYTLAFRRVEEAFDVPAPHRDVLGDPAARRADHRAVGHPGSSGSATSGPCCAPT